MFLGPEECTVSRKWIRAQATTLRWSCTSLSQKDKLFLHTEEESQQAPDRKLHALF